ncbi:hypothetical protein [Arthrobacter sp. BF1]|uniref:hypothetical protein n=1 Tax=Arthrobacter sp. BF1 TaxID=2821145 RepID=UPI001C4E9FF1|nr:hypothetical protein [Arthrobacter sp. BF1]
MDHSARPSAIPGYEDWPAHVRSHRPSDVPSRSGALAGVLGVPAPPAEISVVVDWEDTHDGVTTSAISWQLGFGPRTQAWRVTPAGATGQLPGILALHCHGGNKYTGASRLVEFPPGRSEPDTETDPRRHDLYGSPGIWASTTPTSTGLKLPNSWSAHSLYRCWQNWAI